MKTLFILIFLLPVALFGQVKGKSPTKSVIKSAIADTLVQRGKTQLLNGDTVKACLNFMIAKGMGYYKVNHYYGGDEEEYEDDVVTSCYDENLQIKEAVRNNPEFKKLNYPPLEFLSAEVLNDGISPILRVEMHNNTSKIVDAFKCTVKCYNRFDEPIKGLSNSNSGTITSQTIIEPGEDGGGLDSYSFYFYDGTTKIKIALIKVHFQDGGIWTPKVGQTVSIVATSAF